MGELRANLSVRRSSISDSLAEFSKVSYKYKDKYTYKYKYKDNYKYKDKYKYKYKYKHNKHRDDKDKPSDNKDKTSDDKDKRSDTVKVNAVKTVVYYDTDTTEDELEEISDTQRHMI